MDNGEIDEANQHDTRSCRTSSGHPPMTLDLHGRISRHVQGGCQAFLQGAVVGGELADVLLEGGVLGGDPLDGLFGPFGLQVADLAEEFADAGALGEDLRVGGLEGVLGVERPLPPGEATGTQGEGAGSEGLNRKRREI